MDMAVITPYHDVAERILILETIPDNSQILTLYRIQVNKLNERVSIEGLLSIEGKFFGFPMLWIPDKKFLLVNSCQNNVREKFMIIQK